MDVKATIQALRIGEEHAFNGVAVVRHKRHVYLAIERPVERYPSHSRWGTASEIASDVEHCLAYGVLPRERCSMA